MEELEVELRRIYAGVNMNKFYKQINVLYWGGIFFCFTVVFYKLYFEGTDYLEHSNNALKLLHIFDTRISEVYNTLNTKQIVAYPMWHICVCFAYLLLSLFTNTTMIMGMDLQPLSSAITTSIFLCGAIYIYYRIIKKELPGAGEYSKIIALALAFIGPYYVTWINPSYYLGQGIFTTWHNPTTIAVQPWTVLVAYLFYQLYNGYINKTCSKRDYIRFSILLFFSAFFKPSFYQIFVPGIALFCIVILISSLGKKLRFCIYAGFASLPVALLTLLITQIKYSDAALSIGFGWLNVWSVFSPHPILSICISTLFPLYVLLICVFTKQRDTFLGIGICCFISGTLQYMLLYIKTVPYNGDFAWGFNLALQILFVSSFFAFMNIVKKIKSKIILSVGVILFTIHIISGFLYVAHYFGSINNIIIRIFNV